MARYAVTFASNGPKGSGELRFAEDDADRLSAALGSSRCDFKVRRLPRSCKPGEIEDVINEVAQGCTANDTFLVYFSGHGFIDRGALLLMLDGTSPAKPLTTAMHVDSIVRSLRYCDAGHKLLILDCCHAGMVFADSRFKSQLQADLKPVISTDDEDATSFVTLLASDRLEQAREFDDLGGSFMSATISQALESEMMNGDVDGDGAIDLRDLKEWLRLEARERNRTTNGGVPVPFTYGRERGRLYLTRDPSDWPIVEIDGHNGHKLVPIRMLSRDGDHIWLVGTTPVTNAQYRACVIDQHISPPKGCSFNRVGPEYWVEGFEPWKEPNFSDPSKPVVCVSARQAYSYAIWLNHYSRSSLEYFVTPPEVWDTAAFGHPYPSFDKRLLPRNDIHDKAEMPAAVDDGRRQPNRYGIQDLFGNVWEWTCSRRMFPAVVLGWPGGERSQELRGGGFLDDLGTIMPVLTAGQLEHSTRTRHCDLGFRIAALVPLKAMPNEIRVRAAALGSAYRSHIS
ncbi:MAG: hypothetical protein BVN33_06150 [Proteobacteria bacterium ST_bin13]|nr:MAG: hypothetical protein BVN33_06150 [Proteobacteria bacterium ST_bin13]